MTPEEQFELAEHRRIAGDTAKAAEAYERIIETYPGTEEAQLAGLRLHAIEQGLTAEQSAPTADSAEGTPPPQWVLQVGNTTYPAGDFATIRQWYNNNQIKDGHQVYNPDAGQWLSYAELTALMHDNIIMTTTGDVGGQPPKRYLGIESAEVVLGTGVFSEVGAAWADTLGTRASGYETKLADAKQAALGQLRQRALQLGGNAVLGVKLDYLTLANDKLGLVVSGTVVEMAQAAG